MITANAKSVSYLNWIKYIQLMTLVLALVASSTSTYATETYEGTVIKVLDGDTIDILSDGQPLRIRLAQIDAPEKAQAFGKVSRQNLADLVAGRFVQIEAIDVDKYKRIIGRVEIAGRDVSAEQVRAGMAWVYRKYATDSSLYALESRAKAEQRGLWQDNNPIAPWDWRKSNRSGHAQE